MSLVPMPENLIYDKQRSDKSVIAQEKHQIKEWIQMQPHLPQELDDEWLEKALSACKHSVTRCKEKIESYYTIRSILPDFFTITDNTIDEIKQHTQSSHIFSFLLPKWTPDGNRIFMWGLFDDKFQHYDPVVDLRKSLMLRDLSAEISEIWKVVIIFDTTSCSIVHATRMAPHIRSVLGLFLLFYLLWIFHTSFLPLYRLRKLIYKKSSIARVKQIHIINVNPAAKAVINAIMPLIKEKVRNRFFIHSSDLSTFYNYVPQNILPTEYGGEAGSVKQINDDWLKLLESKIDWLAKEYSKRSDESKRPAHCPLNDMFGVDGSFKTLSID